MATLQVLYNHPCVGRRRRRCCCCCCSIFTLSSIKMSVRKGVRMLCVRWLCAAVDFFQQREPFEGNIAPRAGRHCLECVCLGPRCGSQPASQRRRICTHSGASCWVFFLNARLVSARWEKKSIEWARQTKRLKTSIMHSGAWCHWLEEKRVRAGRQKESFRVGLSSAKNSSSCGL